MTHPLLDRVLPEEWADRSQVIDFKGVIGDFERLSSLSERDLRAVDASERPQDWPDWPVEVELSFGWLDPDRQLPAARGRITAAVPAVCQRCLETFEMPIDVAVNIVFGDVESAKRTAAQYDVWDLDDQAVRVQDVVEETIVMALPLAPTHGSASDCGVLAERLTDGAAEVVRPFAGLRAQMDERND